MFYEMVFSKYIYQIISGSGSYHVQFDEQLRLMAANDVVSALRKAEEVAGTFQPAFKNCKGEDVTWKFVCVADLHEIQMPADGAEVTSILHEPIDVPAFLSSIQQRKTFLENNIKCKDEFIETL